MTRSCRKLSDPILRALDIQANPGTKVKRRPCDHISSQSENFPGLSGCRSPFAHAIVFFLVLIHRRGSTTDLVLLDFGFDKRARVEFLAANEPVDTCTEEDEGQENNGVVHVIGSDWSDGWEDEDDTDEECPDAGPGIDKDAPFAHVPWTRFEFAKSHLAEDGDDIRPIKCDGAYIKHTRDGNIGPESDQIDGDAPEDTDPDCVQWSSSEAVDLGPDVREGNQAIAGIGKHGAAQRLRGSKADELQDDERRDREEDARAFPEGVVKDLCHRLEDW